MTQTRVKTMKNWLICFMMAATATAAQADAPRFRVHGSVAYAQGGDPLISEVYDTGQTFELIAGTGWVWTVGADFRITDSIAIQGSVGHQRNRAIGSNFNFDFQRQPVELLVFYAASEHVRLGLGARKVQNAKLTGNELSAAINHKATGSYDSSVGQVLEVQYLFSPPSLTERKLVTGMNLRFVRENFTQAEESGGTGVAKKGDHIAIGLVFYY